MMNSNSTAKVFAASALIFLMSVTSCMTASGKSPLESHWLATGKAYPAGKQFTKPAAWAPGQYVITGSTVKGKINSMSRLLLVRKEAGGWVIESAETDKKGVETVSQMLMLGYDEAIKNNDASKFKLLWMKSKNREGNIQKIEGEQLTVYNIFAKSTYEKLMITLGNFADGGVTTVPAGSFTGTNFQKASVKILGMTIETESWYHAAVPVNGVVKSRTTDGKSVTELLSFGFDGKSTFE